MDIENVIKNMNIFQRTTPEDGDYYEDGLLKCGKCHTFREKHMEFNGVDYIVKDICQCREEERMKKERREEEQRHQTVVDYLRRNAFPKKRPREWMFDESDNSKAAIVSKNFVSNFEQMKNDGTGLMFFGNVGVGKTFYAACIINALVEKEIPCLFTDITRISNELSESFAGRKECLDSLDKYQLLVLDDIASERDTEYMNEMVYTVINSRYLSGLPLIVTTNLTGDEIKSPNSIQKERIFSRLYQMCVPVPVEGKDRRISYMKDNSDKYKTLLGL